MKKWIAVLFIVMVSTSSALAQRNAEVKERIHAALIAYITDRLHLTTAQSTEFIPIFNEYEQEVKVVRQSYKKKYRAEHPEADDVTIMQYVFDDLDFQQKVILIKRTYRDRFLKVITPQQFGDLNAAEREFKQILMQRIRKDGKAGAFK